MVLDAQYRIEAVGPAAQAGFGSLEGRSLWEVFPDSKPLFYPYYEKARRTGEPVEFVQFYNGYLARIRAVPKDDRLLLFWEEMHRLDTLTLDGFRASLVSALEVIEESEARIGRERVRDLLHVVDGSHR
jgi:PAS domain-containing protein